MPTKLFATHAFAALIALAGFAASGDARADDEFDVNVAGGKVVVTAKGAWHINKDYPWKLVVGDAKLDKSKFEISEKTASVAGAPKGSGKLKGAVCSGDKCKNFEKDVNIP
jgi:hypothetical protein